MPPLLLFVALGCTIPVTSFDEEGVDSDSDPTVDDTDAPDTDVVPDTDDSEAPPDTYEPDTDDTEDTDDTQVDPGADPLLVEVCDGEEGWRYVEIYNPRASTLDLQDWKLAKYSNGQTSPTGSPLSLDGVEIAARGTLVIGYDQAGPKRAFQDAFGRDADLWTTLVDGNGDDVYALIEGVDLRDVYGEIGEDGSGEPWEYEDTCARRKPASDTARTVWRDTDWDIDVDASPFDRD